MNKLCVALNWNFFSEMAYVLRELKKGLNFLVAWNKIAQEARVKRSKYEQFCRRVPSETAT